MVKRGRAFIIILIFIILVAVFLTFIYTPKCKDIACWESKLSSCSKASYISDPRDITWQYTIKGKSHGKCEVNVKVIEIRNGLTSSLVLEGKDMDCLLPLKTLTEPESNPNLCHGVLKEEMQTLIIEKLHQYVVQNIGQIKGNLTSIEGIISNTPATNSSNSTLNKSRY